MSTPQPVFTPGQRVRVVDNTDHCFVYIGDTGVIECIDADADLWVVLDAPKRGLSEVCLDPRQVMLTPIDDHHAALDALEELEVLERMVDLAIYHDSWSEEADNDELALGQANADCCTAILTATYHRLAALHDPSDPAMVAMREALGMEE